MSRTSSLPDLLTYLNERKQMSTYNDVLEIFGGKSEDSKKKSDYTFAPEGDNVAVIKDAGSGTNSKGPYLFQKFYFPEVQKEEWSFNNIDFDNPGATKALAAQFSSLGLKPRSRYVEDLTEEIRKSIGWTVRLTKKSNKGSQKNKEGKDVWFRNYYVKSVISRGDPVAAVEDEDESIPF